MSSYPPQHARDKFKRIFDGFLPYYRDPLIGMTGSFSLDVYKFEEFLTTKGYDPESDQSIDEFILEHYSQEAVDFVHELIDGYK